MIRYRDSWFAITISRPILIVVLNLLIIIGGFASYMGVDVRELPDIDRPVVGIRAVYRGASPTTMDAEVTSIVEGAVSRVAGVKNITSSSEENNMRIRAEFSPSADLNVAASDVREAVNRVQRNLPKDIDQLIVLKADADADPIIQLTATSSKLTQQLLEQRLQKDVIPELVSIEGVAEVRIEGSQTRTLKVILDPARLAGHRVNVSEVVRTLQTSRFDVPAGSYKSLDQELLVRAYASAIDPGRIEKLFVRENVRVGDLGSVIWAPQQAESYTLLNGRLVIGLEVVRQAGTNTIEIASQVRNKVELINKRTRDYLLTTVADDSVYINGALQEVLFSLLISIAIVLLLIWIFLGNAQAVLIPAVTMPVALIGTIAAIWICGFSINLLTLLALVLATGLIVDDAIVVLENIQRNVSNGIPRLAASVIGTEQVFFAVIATTVTLVAVFVPIAFLPGEAGRIFREFGLVLAISVVISSFVAISLCPLMTAHLSDDYKSGNWTQFGRKKLEGFGNILCRVYFYTLNLVLKFRLFIFLSSTSLAILGLMAFNYLDKELLPKEDKGAIEIIATGPDGASLQYADRQSQQIEAELAFFQDQGIIKDIYTIVGRWDRNRVYTRAILIPWYERKISQMDLAAQLSKKLKKIPGVSIRVRQRSSLNIRGAGRGIQLAILGNDYDQMYNAANELASELEQKLPAVTDASVQFDTSQPEISYNIDREKARDLSVAMDDISETLRVMVDEYEIMNLSIQDQAVPLIVASSKGAIKDPGDLLNIFVINQSGELVPLAALITVHEKGVAAELDRHAQRRAIEIDLGLDPKVPAGAVINAIQEIAMNQLPSDMSFIFLGESKTLNESNSNMLITFLIAFIVIFLVLAAQFESFGSALIVIFTVPYGLSVAIFALIMSGQSLNLYSQIGLVMLVGLMTKNAILLVEFMDQLRDQGRTVYEAVEEGVRVRLRPVAMTVLSTVIGSLPLILSNGPGAEARSAIGWVVFGGLGLSTFVTLYLTPLGYSLIAPLVKPRSHSSKQLIEQIETCRLNDSI